MSFFSFLMAAVTLAWWALLSYVATSCLGWWGLLLVLAAIAVALVAYCVIRCAGDE